MEPPCATVCPTEAIIVGDMDDPASRVSKLIATKQVSVRKPEKGTRPKVFYIEGEPSALTPGIADPRGGYMFADRRGADVHDYPTVRFEPDAGLGAVPSAAATAASTEAGAATTEACAATTEACATTTEAGATTAAGSPPGDWVGSGLLEN